MNVGTKPSMSVCYICAYRLHVRCDLQCQDNQFDIINDNRQDSCDAVSCSFEELTDVWIVTRPKHQ